MAMRITQGMTNRTYLYNLNTAQYNMNKSSEKLQTGRKYSHVSDDVHGATKCLSLKTKLYRNDRVRDGVTDALNEFELAESTLKSIGDIASNVQSEMIKAMDDIKRGSAKDTYLSFLKESKDEMLRLANTKYNDKYIFGDLKVEQAPYITKNDGSNHTVMAFRDTSGAIPVSAITSSKVDQTSDQYYNDNLELRKRLSIDYHNENLTIVKENQVSEVINKKLNEIESYVRKNFPKVSSYSDCWNKVKAGIRQEGGVDHLNCLTDSEESYQKLKEIADLYDCVSNLSSDDHIYVIHNDIDHYDAIGAPRIERTQYTVSQFSSSEKNVTQDFYYMHGGEPLDLTHNNYIDVGLDMSSKVNTNASKFNVTVDGLKAFGYGINSDTNLSNNLYDMLTEMEKAIETDDVDKLDVVYNQFKKQTDILISSVAEIGIRGNFLESTLSRLENENAIMKDAQSNLEATDDATEIAKFKGYQTAWNTVLQFGGSIFPKSLMDYVN